MNLCTENQLRKGSILKVKLDDLFFRNKTDFKRGLLSKVLFAILFLFAFLIILIQLKLLITDSRQLVSTPKNYTELNKDGQRQRPDHLVQKATGKLFINSIRNERSQRRSRRAISLLNSRSFRPPARAPSARFARRFVGGKSNSMLALPRHHYVYEQIKRKKKSIIMFNKLIDTIKKLVENKPVKSGMTKYPKTGDYSSELRKEQSINHFTTPSFVKQFVDKDEKNKQNLVRWYNRPPGVHSSPLLLNSTDDQLPSRLFGQPLLEDAEGHKSSESEIEILADRPEPKYNGYHSSSMPFLYDNPRMISYSENTYKPDVRFARKKSWLIDRASTGAAISMRSPVSSLRGLGIPSSYQL